MISMASARRYGQVMNLIHEQQRRAEYLKTPEGQAEQAREAVEAAAEAERQHRLLAPIPLVLPAETSDIVFGTDISRATDVFMPLNRVPHMLIAGVSGSGKSVFTHSLLYQLLRRDGVERLILIDLKGGVEFYRYRDNPKVRVVWEYADVVSIFDQLIELMAERQSVMRKCGWQNWPHHGRIFVVIDEYAELQSDIDAADTREEKATARRLSANIVRLARRARALGIVLVCALQKPTMDAMDSSVRSNLSLRICLRMSNAMASSVLDGLDNVPVMPASLRTGRFICYNSSRGIMRYLQAHIAPGVILDGAS